MNLEPYFSAMYRLSIRYRIKAEGTGLMLGLRSKRTRLEWRGGGANDRLSLFLVFCALVWGHAYRGGGGRCVGVEMGMTQGRNKIWEPTKGGRDT